MNKSDIVQAILQTLKNELTICESAARASSAAASDPDSKAENKYDTRTLEASYIARGQSMRLRELQEAVADYEALAANAGNVKSKVGIGSLILLASDAEDSYYYLGPAVGGVEVTAKGEPIAVITPSSPLGMKLMGKLPGHSFELSPGKADTNVQILSIE